MQKLETLKTCFGLKIMNALKTDMGASYVWGKQKYVLRIILPEVFISRSWQN